MKLFIFLMFVLMPFLVDAKYDVNHLKNIDITSKEIAKPEKNYNYDEVVKDNLSLQFLSDRILFNNGDLKESYEYKYKGPYNFINGFILDNNIVVILGKMHDCFAYVFDYEMNLVKNKKLEGIDSAVSIVSDKYLLYFTDSDKMDLLNLSLDLVSEVDLGVNINSYTVYSDKDCFFVSSYGEIYYFSFDDLSRYRSANLDGYYLMGVLDNKALIVTEDAGVLSYKILGHNLETLFSKTMNVDDQFLDLAVLKDGSFYLPLMKGDCSFNNAVKIDSSYNESIVKNPFIDLEMAYAVIDYVMNEDVEDLIQIDDDKYLYATVSRDCKLFIKLFSLSQRKVILSKEVIKLSDECSLVNFKRIDDYVVLFSGDKNVLHIFIYDSNLNEIFKKDVDFLKTDLTEVFMDISPSLVKKNGIDYIVDYCANGSDGCLDERIVSLHLEIPYFAKVNKQNGGTIKLDKDVYNYGDLVKFDIVADDGFELKGVNVVDSLGKSVEVSSNSFKMPDSDVTIEPIFVLAGVLDNPNTSDYIIISILALVVIFTLGSLFYKKKKTLE